MIEKNKAARMADADNMILEAERQATIEREKQELQVRFHSCGCINQISNNFETH